MIKLRSYQIGIVEQIQYFWCKGLKSLLVFLATRGGKTYIFADVTKKANDKGNRVLILTNRKKLFTQTGNVLADFGIDVYTINADTKTIEGDHMTYIAMSQTLKNRIKKPEFIEWFKSIPFIMADEAHLQDVCDILKNPLCKDKYVLGFTGSPIRGGAQRELGQDFQQIVTGAYTYELEPKYCVPAKVYEVPFDMCDVKKDNKGEFNNWETFQKFDSPKIYKGALNNWLLYAKGLTTLCYCVNIIHAVKTCVEFNNAGIKCKFISSGKSKPKLSKNPNKGAITKYKIALEEYNFFKKYSHLTGETNKIINEWENRDFPILINVDMLSFGYDNNRIDCILADIATNSIPRWLQLANRGGTPRSGKKEFILLDMGGNSERLKDYNYKHEWSLFHKKPSKIGGVPSSKECIKCGALIYASARICDGDLGCGAIQPKSKEQQEVELVERFIQGMKYSDLVKKLNTIEKILLLYRVKKYKKTWIFRTVFYNLGEEKFISYMQEREENYSNGYIQRLLDIYKK